MLLPTPCLGCRSRLLLRPLPCWRQVGGYLEECQDFTFATVRHAGHEAPYTGGRAGGRSRVQHPCVLRAAATGCLGMLERCGAAWVCGRVGACVGEWVFQEGRCTAQPGWDARNAPAAQAKPSVCAVLFAAKERTFYLYKTWLAKKDIV